LLGFQRFLSDLVSIAVREVEKARLDAPSAALGLSPHRKISSIEDNMASSNFRWIRHQLTVPAGSPVLALASFAPTDSAEVAPLLAAFIELPDLSGWPTPQAKAEILLRKAAEVEHSLMIEYLYAWFSLKNANDSSITDPNQKAALNAWRPLLGQIAREEMAHLMTVQNLRTLLNLPPCFERDDFPIPKALYPFTMHLEPLSQGSLAKYVAAESRLDQPGIDDVVRQATGAAGMAVNHVGVLYALLGVLFAGGVQEVEQDAAGNDPWYLTVRRIAYLAYSQQPPSEAWHLPPEALHPQSAARQASGDDWVKPANAGMRVPVVASRQGAKGALRDIGLQGEGPASPADEVSHFDRFLSVYRGTSGALPFPAPGGWSPAYAVPTDPRLSDNPSDPRAILNPVAQDWARLADLRYALLLGFLEQYFLTDPPGRDFLRGYAMEEMYRLRSLRNKLVTLPRVTGGDPGQRAAPPFTLPSPLPLPAGAADRWDVHIGRVTASLALVEKMLGSTAPGDPTLPPLRDANRKRLEKLRQMKAGAAAGRSAAAATGAATRLDRVREILNAAATNGNPSHGGAGRFWNLPRDGFLQAVVYGLNVIETQGDNRGARSNLIKALKGEPPFDGADFERMPLNRPPVGAADIAFIQQWIDDGCPEDPLSPAPGGPTPATGLAAVRLLPPFAIGRMGNSPSPMDNYELVPDPADVKAPLALRPAPTLRVDPATGRITGSDTPAAVRFRDDQGRIKPVAPFLEVWGQFQPGGPLEPLTARHLADLGATVEWRVQVANLKVFRRTGDANDRVTATVEWFSDHAAKPLLGTCANFVAGKSIFFGAAQFIDPSSPGFPQLRLRWTPPPGKVYGPAPRTLPLQVADDVYDAGRGKWVGHVDGAPGTPPPTSPGSIFYGHVEGQGDARMWVGNGYLDDASDGVVEVRVTFAGQVRTAYARISAGPPTFAPDSRHVRTVADELEQIAVGPLVTGPADRDRAVDVVRRAVETVRLMNTAAMNGNPTPRPVSNMARHDNGFGRALEPIFPPTLTDYRTIRALHEGLLARVARGDVSGVVDLLRRHDRAGDLSDAGRRRMPGMMRGSDALHLALTRRQVALIDALTQPATPPVAGTPEQNLRKLIAAFSDRSVRHLGIPIDGGRTLAELFADPTALMNYLRTAQAKGPRAGALQGRPLVVPGQPDQSAFVLLLRDPNHPMHAPFTDVTVADTGKTGLAIVEEWVRSLP
jgi:hypothetical protein